VRRRLGREIAALAVVSLTLPPPVRAAEEKPPQSRIRVTTLKGRTVGTLVEVRGETLVLERPRGERVERVEIRKAEVVALERSERRSHKGTGAMIGALAGVGAGVVFGLVAGDEGQSVPGPATLGNLVEKLNSNLCFSRGDTMVLGGILFVPLGALVGYAVAPGEKWKALGISELDVRPVVSRNGAGVQVAIRF
jgi:hypothetical protein